MDRQEQLRKAAGIQRLWSAQAMRDAKYNHKQALTQRALGNTVLARMYEQEEQYDRKWAERRSVWAKHPAHMMYPKHLQTHSRKHLSQHRFR